jgi:hypothetical protein
VERLGGFIALTASPGHLREYAVAAYVLPDCIYRGMAVLEIDWPDGELQISADYRARVSAAQVARREVLATAGPQEILQERIWARGTEARNRGRVRSRPHEPRQPDPPLASARPPRRRTASPLRPISSGTNDPAVTIVAVQADSLPRHRPVQ